MDGEVKVAINYDRIADDSRWDGLKGYLTNTDIPIQDVYTQHITTCGMWNGLFV